MDAKVIEIFDRKRYRALTFIAGGAGLMFGLGFFITAIVGTKIEKRLPEILEPLMGLMILAGFCTFIAGCVKYARNAIFVRKQTELKEALNNELVQSWRLRSVMAGLVALIAFLMVIYALESSHFNPLKGGAVAVYSTFITYETYLITLLIHMRR